MTQSGVNELKVLMTAMAEKKPLVANEITDTNVSIADSHELQLPGNSKDIKAR